MRKVAFIFLSIFTSSFAYALDLGELVVRSVPGEELQAIVPILDPPADLTQLRASLATEEEFSDAVIAYEPAHDELKLLIVPNGREPYIRINSVHPLQEEVMHFLLVLESANSRLLREYVIIQEGSLYAANAQPTIIKTSRFEKKANAPRLPVVALGESHERKSKLKSAAAVRTANVYQVKRGDSLWVIAQKVHRYYDSATFYQVMAGLYQTNQSVFIQGNINKLLAGSTLDLPAVQHLTDLTRLQAIDFIENQLMLAEQNKTQVPGVPMMPMMQADELRILAPKTAEELTSEQEKLGHDLALVNESLEKVQRDNESLQSRVKSLQAQIDTLEKMLALRKKNAHHAFIPTEHAEEVVPPGIQLSSTGWSAVHQLWQEINRNQWMYYLILSLGGFAILLLVVSGCLIYYIRRADKMIHASVAAVSQQAKIKPDQSRKKQNVQEKPIHKNTNEDNEKIAIKLELAQAYYNLNDTASAGAILQDILREGNPKERKAAEELLAKIDKKV